MTSKAHHIQRARETYFSFPVMPRQNPWLDYIRSVAIILVILRHGQKFFPLPLDGWLGTLPGNFMTNGWIGVDLFLVLSGYLISTSLSRSYKPGAPIKVSKYFRSRIFRIVPAYYVSLLLVVCGAFPYYSLSMDVTPVGVIYHLLFLQDYLTPGFNVVFWSLGVEEKFYIFAPLLLMCLLKAKTARTGFLILAALLLISPLSKTIGYYSYAGEMSFGEFWHTLRRPFHQVLEPLIAGVAISFIERRKLIQLSHAQARKLLFWSSAILVSLMCSHDFYGAITFFDLAPQPLIHAGLFSAIVFAGINLAGTHPVGTPVWRPTARLSYAIYLMHYPFTSLALVIASQSALPYLTYWFYYLAFSILAALALHFAVEKPFMTLKEKKWARPKRALASAG